MKFFRLESSPNQCLVILLVLVSFNFCHSFRINITPLVLNGTNDGASGINRDGADNTNQNDTLSSKGTLSVSSSNLNPSTITNQIQAVVQSFINSLNSTLSSSTSSLTSLFGSVKNMTSGIKPKNGTGFRSEAEALIQNVTQLVRNSTDAMRQEPEASNSSSAIEQVESGVEVALQEFQRSLLRLGNGDNNATREPSGGNNRPLRLGKPEGRTFFQRRSGNPTEVASNNNNNNNYDDAQGEGLEDGEDNWRGMNRRENGLQRMWKQISTIRARVDQSVTDARSRLQESMSSIARQGTQLMRNQTTSMMGEVQRVFQSVSEPFRNFFQSMRRRLPTTVVTA